MIKIKIKNNMAVLSDGKTILLFAAIICLVAVAGVFKIATAATITSIDQIQGPTTGGQTITITGTGFMPTPATPTAMQQMTQAYCATLPVYPAAGSTITLTDTRNNQQYDVRKLQDNKCWMIDNLKLELTNGMTLTPADTAVSTNTTVWFTRDGTQTGTPLAGMTGNFTTSGANTRDNGTTNTSPNQDAWRQNNPNTATWCNTTSNMPTDSKTGCGYLYNFYTATAGTAPQTQASGTASGSICPANWRLPTGVNASGDFGQLDIAYGGTGATQSGTPAQLSTLWLSSGAWRGLFSGHYTVNSLNQNTNSNFWSSSVVSVLYGYNMGFSQSNVYPGTGNGSRYYGSAVRCVVPSSTLTVTFDGVPATNVVVVNDTTITATTPAHAAGTVDVEVTVAGATGTLTQGYTYVPQITSVTPNVGPTSGGNVVTITGAGFASATPTTMQQMTQAYCTNSMSVYPSTANGPNTITLTDSRNGQQYDVRKLADGKCWMIDSLKLELTNGMTLTPQDTAVQSATTVWFTQDGTSTGAPLAGMTGNFTTSGSNTRDNSGVTASPNSDAWRQNNPSTTAWCSNASNMPAGSKSGCGYFYNFYTATAGTAPQSQTSGTASGSICPAGWRLPSGQNASGDFGVLDQAYGGTGGNQGAPAQMTTLWLSSGAWRGLASGFYNSSFGSNQGLVGYFQSSSVLSATHGYDTIINLNLPTNVSPGTNTSDPRIVGTAVRCVVSDIPTPPAVTFGGVPATNVTVVDDTTITATVPASTLATPYGEGAVNVDVSVDSVAADTLTNGYIYRAPMEVTSISPAAGPVSGGTDVLLTGYNFVPYGSYSDSSGNYYRPLESLDFTGTEYINTGTVLNNNTVLWLDQEWAAVNPGVERLSGQGGGLANIKFFITSGNNGTSDTHAGLLNAGTSNATPIAGRHQHSLNSGTGEYQLDGVTKHTFATGSFTYYALLLGASAPNNNYKYVDGDKIYGAKIWQGGNLVQDFVPVCSTAGVGGMWDKVSGTFFGSDSGTDFACAPFTITFDTSGTPADCNITSFSNTQITCTTSSHTPGTVNVVVDNGVESAELPAVVNAPNAAVDPNKPVSGFTYVEMFITLSASQINIDLLSSSTSIENNDSTTVTVTTNWWSGYSLAISSSDPNLTCQTDSSYKFTPTASGALQPKTWGYATGASSPTSYNPVTTSFTTIASSTTATGPSHNGAAGDPTVLWFGARTDWSQKPCVYKGSVTLRAVAQP